MDIDGNTLLALPSRSTSIDSTRSYTTATMFVANTSITTPVNRARYQQETTLNETVTVDSADCRTPLPIPCSQRCTHALSATEWATAPFQSPFQHYPEKYSPSRKLPRKPVGLLSGLYASLGIKQNGQLSTEHHLRHDRTGQVRNHTYSRYDVLSNDSVRRGISESVSLERALSPAHPQRSTQLGQFHWSLPQVLHISRFMYLWKTGICVTACAAHMTALTAAAVLQNSNPELYYNPWNVWLVSWILLLASLEAANGTATYYVTMIFTRLCSSYPTTCSAQAFRDMYVSSCVNVCRVFTLLTACVTVVGAWILQRVDWSATHTVRDGKQAIDWTTQHFNIGLLKSYSQGILFVFLACLLFHVVSVSASIFGLIYSALKISQPHFNVAPMQRQKPAEKPNGVASQALAVESRVTTASSVLH